MNDSLFEQFKQLEAYLKQQIIGQPTLINRLLIALLSDGHLLVEGAPGLAKTRAIRSLSQALEGDFHRIQFTPDLLPADLTGTEIYRPQEGCFIFQKGPLFSHLILADEINRAPAKVQSALLEAMAERQITVVGKTYDLPDFFLVMATQNPIEQEGTYPLPEAQLDRFLMQVLIDYPDYAHEKQILRLARQEASEQKEVPIHLEQKQLFAARQAVLNIYLSEPMEDYILHLILATRQPEKYAPQLKGRIEYGASPRASIALERTAKAHAWLAGRDYVAPQDVQSLAFDVLRHRLILSYEAEAEGLKPDALIQTLIEYVPVP